ncbi:MAG: hypothetical protein M3T55_07775, partial [Pseudomonadota bacterium]|nr:hypothetical protein [Pseudomonadota bacterium]
MKRVQEILLIGVTAVTFSFFQSAGAQEQNFAVTSTLDVLNFDLKSIRQLQPGRFVISTLTLDKPDIMRMRIAATREMYKFCLKPAGYYSPVPSMYGVGSPDLPVNKLDVRVSFDGVGPQRKSYNDVSWKYPYKRAASCDDEHCVHIREDGELVICRETQVENDASFQEWWSVETNGVKSLGLYDCDHGFTGTSFPEWDLDKTVM